MRLELHFRIDVDLSQPDQQVEIRNHIARCLRAHSAMPVSDIQWLLFR